MSWTEIFPILTDEMLDAYQEQVTPEERAQLDAWLGVDRILNPQPASHLVVVSLFRDPERAMMEPSGAGDVGDLLFCAEDSWFELRRLLDGAAEVLARKDTALRVYLSAELAEFADRLTEAGCEVALMKGSSTSNNPAALWRFLALEEEGRWITVTHGNFGHKMIHDVERTEQVMAANLGGWRLPHLVGDKSHRLEARSYRPIHSAHFGAKGGHPTGLLMRALIWHGQRGTMPLGCSEGEGGGLGYPLEGSEWTSFEEPPEMFDHWFLLAALYPRLAFEGLLTFLIWQRKFVNYWYAVDVEYATWANPASEILFTRKIVTPDSPWNELSESGGVAVRSETTVFRRARRKVYEGSEDPLPKKEVLSFYAFKGDLPSLLEWTSGKVETKWWVDASPWLRSFPVGSELFLDRRYEKAEVVVCGHFFYKIDETVAAWAVARGLDPGEWKEGWIRKLPKLEGPLTLWRTEFSRQFCQALAEQPAGIRPELLLSAWMQQGKAIVQTTSAARMGWRLG
ncbi:hypothetical protein JIN85_17840 [Luteolibacter pohnpeiensis]|uniref:Uncharacterized protein n=1 Tax=Luteolibacter pohnpeiensis TaxID=454153 RepID=A0A934VSG7_9BACT|nr:hypothetical protein [Luteolibacter pohnpeiensis]MBK1884286.1 hypothetical protein [Luteolibacter pohnpeiensis]